MLDWEEWPVVSTCQNVEGQPGVRVFVVNSASPVQLFVPAHDAGQIWDNYNLVSPQKAIDPEDNEVDR